MAETIELPESLYGDLVAEAAQRDRPVEEYVRHLLEARRGPGPGEFGTADSERSPESEASDGAAGGEQDAGDTGDTGVTGGDRRAYYERLVENLPIGFFRNTPGPDGELLLSNDAMVGLFDAESKAELRSYAVSDLYADPAEREAFSEQLMSEGIVQNRELRLQTLTGEPFWVTVTAVAREVDGRTVFDGAVQDISDRKAYERQLREQRDNLDLLNQVLRHDIRNDLQVVTAYADALADEVDDDDNREYVTAIQESAQHAIELTTTVRDLSDVMLTTEDDYGPVSLTGVLDAEIDDMRDTFSDAIVTVDGTVPNVSVRANDLLNSVFDNLLTNAVQHNDKAVPEVTVSVSAGEETATVRVADNGPGVPEGQKEEIFGRGGTGLDSDGTGIGLYLVQTLVEGYGGSVSVADDEPEGTVFIVTLPRAE